jgi:putative ABC transport system permease protein
MSEIVRIAFRGLNSNRTRSLLTMLGILIGVASVVVLVAVGNGSSIAVAKQFQALGTNTLTVSAGGFGPRGRQGNAAQFVNADLDALRASEYDEYIKAVVPQIAAAGVVVALGETTNTPNSVIGTTHEALDALSWKVASGRFLTADDIELRLPVVVLGTRVKENLWGEEVDPVGETVLVGGTRFEVIGVLAKKGANGVVDQDDVLFLPWTTARDTIAGGSTINRFTVQATSAEKTAQAQTVITDVLNERHPSTNGQQRFNVLNQAALLSSRTEASRTLTVLLAAVAAISLLVGGIGIMNIMLVTVTERTREIGIRKAIGAPQASILGQFLVEAVLLAGIGGSIGVALGIVGARFNIAGIEPVVRYDSVVLAFAVAVVVGLFFGFWPARRAAAMRPIDALRHE